MQKRKFIFQPFISVANLLLVSGRERHRCCHPFGAILAKTTDFQCSPSPFPSWYAHTRLVLPENLKTIKTIRCERYSWSKKCYAPVDMEWEAHTIECFHISQLVQDFYNTHIVLHVYTYIYIYIPTWSHGMSRPIPRPGTVDDRNLWFSGSADRHG